MNRRRMRRISRRLHLWLLVMLAARRLAADGSNLRLN